VVKKIYSLIGCTKCLQAKKKFPEAEYIMLNELTSEERDNIIQQSTSIGLVSAPILIDENEKILTHEEAGI